MDCGRAGSPSRHAYSSGKNLTSDFRRRPCDAIRLVEDSYATDRVIVDELPRVSLLLDLLVTRINCVTKESDDGVCVRLHGTVGSRGCHHNLVRQRERYHSLRYLSEHNGADRSCDGTPRLLVEDASRWVFLAVLLGRRRLLHCWARHSLYLLFHLQAHTSEPWSFSMVTIQSGGLCFLLDSRFGA